MNYKCVYDALQWIVDRKVLLFFFFLFVFWKVFETHYKNSDFVTVVFMDNGIFTEDDSPFFF